MKYHAFVTDGGARYLARNITPQEAAGFGCPGYDAVLRGRHGEIVTKIGITGRVKRRIPKQGGDTGYRAFFVAPTGGEITGWIQMEGGA